MKYGCIGERLGHSFSKEIHSLIADYEYVLKELAPDDVAPFLEKSNFLAINVTIPYKEKVIPYLSHIDDAARLIGAVNTVVNRGGELFGYNTDFYGMSKLAEHAKIDFCEKKVLILGTGGTSKTAYAVAKAHGATSIVKASRNPSKDAVSYTDVYKYHTDSEIIINTTPLGMYPNIFGKPIELYKFPKLYGVLDAVYNPINTPLILEARKLGIRAEGGLYMLVAQGVRASEIFLDTKYDESTTDLVYEKIRADKQNIVLIGMPASGKTTVGKLIAEKLGRRFIDTDDVIRNRQGKEITEIFAEYGEPAFRNFEAEAIAEVSAMSSAVIATGGGAILRKDNVDALSENGKIYFIDRPLDMLIPTGDRPTASTKEAISKRFSERYDLYRAASDVAVDGSAAATDVAKTIIEDFFG